MSIPDGIEFLMPWRIIEDSHEIEDRAGRLSERLQSEIPEKHVLHGLKVRAIATRVDRDDVLLEIEGALSRAIPYAAISAGSVSVR